MAEPEKEAKETKPEKEKKAGFFSSAAKKAALEASKDVGEKVLDEVGKQVTGLLNHHADRFELFGQLMMTQLRELPLEVSVPLMAKIGVLVADEETKMILNKK